MTLVNIDLRNQGYETGPDDRVIFYSLLVREGDFGTISTAPVEVELVDGKATVDLAPGPVGVQILAGQVADTRVKIGEVPPSGTTTLNAVMMVTPAYTPALQAQFLKAIQNAQAAAMGKIGDEVAVAVDAEMGAIDTRSQEALNRSNDAKNLASGAVVKATSASTAASSAVSRVTALEALGGLSPESPVDGQTANLLSQADTLTRAAVNDAVTGIAMMHPVELFGAIGDGVADDTQAWNDAIAHVHSVGGGTVTGSPHKVYMIAADSGESAFNNYGGITALSGVDIHIPDTCTLKAFPVGTVVSKIIRITDQENVRVYGSGTIDGNRYEATVTTGEWGYGVAVNAGRNIRVEGIRAINCWGDGINLQKLAHSIHTAPENVIISGVTCDNNRRQGMSIEGANGVLVENSTFSNTNGARPGAGLDVEQPDGLTRIENVTIRNNKFLTNERFGLIVADNTVGLMNNIYIENNLMVGNDILGDAAQIRVDTGGRNVSIHGNVTLDTPAERESLVIKGSKSNLSVKWNSFDSGVDAGTTALIQGDTYRPEGADISNNVFLGGSLKIGGHHYFIIKGNLFRTSPEKPSIMFNESVSHSGTISGNTFSGGLHGIDMRHNNPPQMMKISDNLFVLNGDSAIKLRGMNHDIRGNTFHGTCAYSGEAVIHFEPHWEGCVGHTIEGNRVIEKYLNESNANTPMYVFKSDSTTASVSLRRNKTTGDIQGFPSNQDTGGGTVLAHPGDISVRATEYRPIAVPEGTQFFDTTLGKMIVRVGSSWRNLDGTALA